VDPFKLAVGALVAFVAASIVLRVATRDNTSRQKGRRNVATAAIAIPLSVGTLVVLAWAIQPVLPGEFDFGRVGLPYFMGDGGVGGTGPGDVGCEPLSAVQKPGAPPLISVGHITWVAPVARDRGWVWQVPIGFEVFRRPDPSQKGHLLVRTGEDCYVSADDGLG
jgi:hypothetical protein